MGKFSKGRFEPRSHFLFAPGECQCMPETHRWRPPPVSLWHALTFTWRKQKMRARLEAALREFSHIDTVMMLSLTEKILLTPFLLEKGVRVLWIEHDRVGRWLTKNPWLPTLISLSA